MQQATGFFTRQSSLTRVKAILVAGLSLLVVVSATWLLQLPYSRRHSAHPLQTKGTAS
jgi:hypothetical protein